MEGSKGGRLPFRLTLVSSSELWRHNTRYLLVCVQIYLGTCLLGQEAQRVRHAAANPESLGLMPSNTTRTPTPPTPLWAPSKFPCLGYFQRLQLLIIMPWMTASVWTQGNTDEVKWILRRATESENQLEVNEDAKDLRWHICLQSIHLSNPWYLLKVVTPFVCWKNHKV